MTLALELAKDGDLDYAETLLREAGLPTAGLRDEAVSLYLAVDGGDRLGIGGIEDYGETGVLRSVVIEPSARGEGHGTALVGALEAEARAAGLQSLVLLTTDAGPFFRGLGYVPTEWAAQPAAVRQTSALSAVCPDSAACLEKRL